MIFNDEAAFNDAFCRRTQELRKGRGWTQEQMATALGVPLERYKKYEIRGPMPLYLIERFSIIVGRDLDFVITGKNGRKRALRVGRARVA